MAQIMQAHPWATSLCGEPLERPWSFLQGQRVNRRPCRTRDRGRPMQHRAAKRRSSSSLRCAFNWTTTLIGKPIVRCDLAVLGSRKVNVRSPSYPLHQCSPQGDIATAAVVILNVRNLRQSTSAPFGQTNPRLPLWEPCPSTEGSRGDANPQASLVGPIAGVLALAQLWVALAFFYGAGTSNLLDAESTVAGASLALGGTVALAAGLWIRPRARGLGNALVVVGAVLGAIWFWTVV